MRILVTGATGFLGRHVIERLKAGNEVVALTRRGDEDLGVAVAKGDITDLGSLGGVAEGCQALVHLAGLVSQAPEDAQRLWDLHVVGTENILEVAKRAGVRRVVYMSTSGTVAVSEAPDERIDESSRTPMNLITRWPYYRSKLFAEEYALSQSSSDFQLLSLNPSLLLGPGDRGGEATKSVRMFLDDKVPISPPGGLSYADVRDVAAVVETALYKGRPGRRYLLGAANLTFQEYYEKLGRLTGKPAPALRAPRAFKKALDFFPGWGKEGFGFGMTVDRVSMEQACHYWYLDDSRARVELGWSPRDPVATLRDTMADILDRSRGVRRPAGI
ncbi:MAG: NAD-dependent epimerase/dehydratase family protein [Alphaproteobacteria bacterium]|nr:NAD-dependent epimerase/dehydratase family protein [Alphaproteobacteria bacterium]